ncbi:MAG: hypothetical protein AAF533_04395 [Acidobacteriota bacterium]
MLARHSFDVRRRLALPSFVLALLLSAPALTASARPGQRAETPDRDRRDPGLGSVVVPIPRDFLFLDASWTSLVARRQAEGLALDAEADFAEALHETAEILRRDVVAGRIGAHDAAAGLHRVVMTAFEALEPSALERDSVARTLRSALLPYLSYRDAVDRRRAPSAEPGRTLRVGAASLTVSEIRQVLGEGVDRDRDAAVDRLLSLRPELAEHYDEAELHALLPRLVAAIAPAPTDLPLVLRRFRSQLLPLPTEVTR